MDRLQQLLHDKGALCHDIESHTQTINDMRQRLVPITAEINKLLQEKQSAPREAAVA